MRLITVLAIIIVVFADAKARKPNKPKPKPKPQPQDGCPLFFDCLGEIFRLRVRKLSLFMFHVLDIN